MVKFFKKLYYFLFPPNQDKYYSNNPSQEYLFIGGANDGRFITIPDNQSKVIVPVPADIFKEYNYYKGFNPVKTEPYYKKLIATRNSRLAIYVVDGMLECEILDRLIENYSKNI